MFKRTTGFATPPPLNVILATLFVLWATLANAQQPPIMTLLNGDIDGDNEVTLFDHGILVANFGLSEQDPGFTPEADLDGDTEVTLFDFGILVNHFGEIGVDALTGVEQPMEEGLTVPLRLQLSDWGGHPSRVISVEFRAKAVGTESNPDAPVYVKTVGIVASSAEVDVELTLPAGAYTVQAKASHWLRGEGSIVTPPSWIFAAATGVNKITVYWSPVPGATGYRIFRSTRSGVYDYDQPVATVGNNTFRWTNTGLSMGVEYFYVAQAIANGSNNTVSTASDEDSDVPDAQSIPWDESPTSILQTVRRYVSNRSGGLRVMAPDGSVYIEGYQIAFPPDGYVDTDNSQLVLSGMSIPMPSCLTFEQQEQIKGQSRQPQKIDAGAFRRIVSRSQYNNEQYEGVSGFVYLPKVEPANLSLQRSEEKPFIYLGVTGDNLEVDAGIMFHRAGYGGPNLPNRWQAFVVVNDRGRKWRGKPLPNDLILLVMGENPSTGNYIWADSELGNYVFIGVYTWQQPRIGWLLVDAFDAYGLYYSQTFCFALRIPNIRQEAPLRFKRVHSMAQSLPSNTPGLTAFDPAPSYGPRYYLPTGSYIRGAQWLDGSLQLRNSMETVPWDLPRTETSGRYAPYAARVGNNLLVTTSPTGGSPTSETVNIRH